MGGASRGGGSLLSHSLLPCCDVGQLKCGWQWQQRQRGAPHLPPPPNTCLPRCFACVVQVDLSGLGSREQRMAFFINTYNALVVHALVVFGAADGTFSRRVV